MAIRRRQLSSVALLTAALAVAPVAAPAASAVALQTGAVVSAARAAALKAPTLTSSVSAAAAGTPITFRGVTTPRVTVTVQRLAGGKWRSVGSTTSNAKGRYTFVAKHVGGRTAYRAVASKGKTAVGGATVYVSAPRQLREYKLYDFTDNEDARLDMGNVAGMGYGESVGVFVDRWVSWNLDGCTKLTTSVGADDDRSPTSTDWSYWANIAVDGKNRFHASKTRGEAATDVTIDLRGARKLGLSVSGNGTVWGRVIYGDLTATCAAPPSNFRAS